MNVIVIGGGASGMACAISCARQGARVTIIEKNEKLGKKMFITGKGRCNVTNDCEVDEFLSNVVTNTKFLIGCINRFKPADTMDYFSSQGLQLKTERGNRVFPFSDRSSDVIKTLEQDLKRLKVDVKLNEKVVGLIVDDGKCSGVKTDLGCYYADKVVVATGGKSYSSTGSTGDGYAFAKSVGHEVVEPMPALAPIYTKLGYRDIAGLTLKNVTLKVFLEDRPLLNEFGELLFTHEGVSGPIVLTASSKISRLDYDKIKLFIDFKPALDEEQLDKRLIRDFEQNSVKQLKNALDDLLPKSIIERVIRASGLNKFKKVCEFSREERQKLVSVLKSFPIDQVKRAPIDVAIITSGGVSVKEVDPKTMQSTKCKGLYFVGEVLDVDALTGGFNLQIAFATAVSCGRNIKE